MKLIPLLLLFATCISGCVHKTERLPPVVDTLVVIQQAVIVDSGWAGHIVHTGDTVSPFRLFENGKTRDTIYETKFVYR